MLSSAGYDPSMALRVELWHATKELLLGQARVPLAKLGDAHAIVPLRRADEDDVACSLLPTPRAGQVRAAAV